jgi:hypothetical protein
MVSALEKLAASIARVRELIADVNQDLDTGEARSGTARRRRLGGSTCSGTGVGCGTVHADHRSRAMELGAYRPTNAPPLITRGHR